MDVKQQKEVLLYVYCFTIKLLDQCDLGLVYNYIVLPAKWWVVHTHNFSMMTKLLSSTGRVAPALWVTEGFCHLREAVGKCIDELTLSASSSGPFNSWCLPGFISCCAGTTAIADQCRWGWALLIFQWWWLAVCRTPAGRRILLEINPLAWLSCSLGDQIIARLLQTLTLWQSVSACSNCRLLQDGSYNETMSFEGQHPILAPWVESAVRWVQENRGAGRAESYLPRYRITQKQSTEGSSHAEWMQEAFPPPPHPPRKILLLQVEVSVWPATAGLRWKMLPNYMMNDTGKVLIWQQKAIAFRAPLDLTPQQITHHVQAHRGVHTRHIE